MTDEVDVLRGMLDDLDDGGRVPEKHIDFLDDMLKECDEIFWNPTDRQRQYIRDLHERYA